MKGPVEKRILSYNTQRTRFKIAITQPPSYENSTFVEEGSSRARFNAADLEATAPSSLYSAISDLFSAYMDERLGVSRVGPVLQGMKLAKIAKEFSDYEFALTLLREGAESPSFELIKLMELLRASGDVPELDEVRRWRAATAKAASLAADLNRLASVLKRPANRPAPIKLSSAVLRPIAARIANALVARRNLALTQARVARGLEAILEPMPFSAEIELRFGGGRKDRALRHVLPWPSSFQLDQKEKETLAQQAAAVVCAVAR